MTPTDALMTVSDAAAFLRVSRRTVYQLIADGALRPIKIRNCTRFTQAMLLAACQPTNTPKAKPAKRIHIEDILSQPAARSACSRK